MHPAAEKPSFSSLRSCKLSKFSRVTFKKRAHIKKNMQEAMLKRAKKDDREEPLSKVELEAIREYRDAVKKGKLISHEQLKKELGARCT